MHPRRVAGPGRPRRRAADGKVIFIQGALPGELVTYAVVQQKAELRDRAVKEIVGPRRMRVAPRCPISASCGGCSQQHLDARAQVAAKQRVLEDNLRHIGKVEAGSIAAGDLRR